MKECCKVPENLKREVISADKAIDTCQVCGCRHFHMKAEPGTLGTYFGKKRT